LSITPSIALTPLNKWDLRYYALAKHISGWSKDPSTKVGAILVGKNRRHLAFGYNGFPPGIEDTEERLNNRELKYKLTQHAERNVLDNATFGCFGGTLAVTMHPCSECAKSIISKGVSRVICPPALNREPWHTDAKVAENILREANVDILFYHSEAYIPGK
jgi:dCMP deaminase